MAARPVWRHRRNRLPPENSLASIGWDAGAVACASRTPASGSNRDCMIDLQIIYFDDSNNMEIMQIYQ
jgi:hypothetical protein